MRSFLLVALLLAAAGAGCLDDSDPAAAAPSVPTPGTLADLVNATAATLGSITLEPSVVDAAVSVSNDLYEPTMEVCDDGSIYITGHTLLVDTTGAPVYGSHDDGASWAQLPLLQGIASPGTLQGATPPPSDEIFLSCGEDGWLYGVDITLATFPVNAWSGNGAMHSYHNPNAYDEAQVVTDASSESGCVPAPAKDRPWGAYSNGKLLMVSNPASGPAQVGVLDVPPMLPVGIGATLGGASWNLCAGPGGLPASCNIPGIPDVRADGVFVVPQRCQGEVVLVIGNVADLDLIQRVELFEHTSAGEITSVYGIAAFDAKGDLFFGISNNTVDGDGETVDGALRFAASRDGGVTYTDRTYTLPGQPLRHFYMDPNDFGAGALVVWAVDGEKDAQNVTLSWDWYVGHLQVGADGLPELTGAYLAIDDGPQPSAHVTGAAAGPDGRAYLAMYEGDKPTPLSVFVQRAGPVLPVDAVAAE